MLGKVVHLGIDALLLSAFLAGIKRSTGLTCVPFSPLSLVPWNTLTTPRSCRAMRSHADPHCPRCRTRTSVVSSPPRPSMFLKSLMRTLLWQSYCARIWKSVRSVSSDPPILEGTFINASRARHRQANTCSILPSWSLGCACRYLVAFARKLMITHPHPSPFPAIQLL